MFVSVRRRGEGSTRARASARRCAVRFRGWIRATAFGSVSPRDWRTRRVLFGKAKRRASGKNIFTMARGRSGPAARDAGTRRAPRGVSRVRNSSRGSLLVGRKGGHAHAAAAANDRPPFQHAALGVNGANLRALEAEHTARHPASGRFNDLGAEVAHGAAEAARLSAFRSAIDTRSRPRTAQAVRRSLCWVWCSAWGRRRTFLWFLPFPEAGNRKARVRICSKGAENREDSSYGHAYSLSSRTHRKYGPTAHFVRVVCLSCAARRRARPELPDTPAAPHFTGGEPAAPGERISTEPARSVEGWKRHRGRLEAHCSRIFIFSSGARADCRVGFHLSRLSALRWRREG